MSQRHKQIILLLGVNVLMWTGCIIDAGFPGQSASGQSGDCNCDDNGTPSFVCPNDPHITANLSLGTCEIEASLQDPITSDLVLDKNTPWVLKGPVFVGGDNANNATLTIEPGATIRGASKSFLVITRGSRIVAEGTSNDPIVFTSGKFEGTRGPQDWGGLIINGNAPIQDGEAQGEVGSGLYGGNNPDDDSGVLKYVRIQFAGEIVTTDDELNGLSFQGVGRGTTVDFVQVHMVSDDGIEFFGGTVDIRHVVITGAQDDSLDWTSGWQGNAQYVLIEQNTDSSANRGIEADNDSDNPNETPTSNPTIANLTLLGGSPKDSEDNDAMRLRRGTMGSLYNFVVSGWTNYCVTVTESETVSNIANGDLDADNFVLNCALGDSKDADSSMLLAGKNTSSQDPLLNGWLPLPGSPALLNMDLPTGLPTFFEATDYAGAFAENGDWATGWIEQAKN